jgi:cobalt-zinc-cadmium efflux system membrane fusion protein
LSTRAVGTRTRWECAPTFGTAVGAQAAFRCVTAARSLGELERAATIATIDGGGLRPSVANAVLASDHLRGERGPLFSWKPPEARMQATRLATLGGLLASLACARPEHAREAAARRVVDGRVTLPEAAARYVVVETVEPSDALLPWPLPARVAADDRLLARVGSPVSGVVASVTVVTGDQVERGDVIADLHSPETAAARADLEQARLRRANAEATAARFERLKREGAGTEAELLDAREALGRAREEVARTGAALAALGGTRAGKAGLFIVRAPISGSVLGRHVTVGTEVRPDSADPLFTIADLSRVWIVADVPPADLGTVIADVAVEIEVDGIAGRQFSGTIDHVAEIVDPITTMARARVVLDNADRALRPGMFARVRVLSGGARRLAVPMSAILTRRDQAFVFVRNDDGTFSRRAVLLGRQAGEHVAVLSGLQPGESVVTGGAILLDVEASEAL